MIRTILTGLICTVALTTLSAGGAHAGVVENKTITEIQVLPDMLLIRADGAIFSYGSGSSACIDNSAVIPQDGSNPNYVLMHKLALAALMTGRKVKVYISGCIGSPSRPKVGELYLY
jgi:hypothetical protein